MTRQEHVLVPEKRPGLLRRVASRIGRLVLGDVASVMRPQVSGSRTYDPLRDGDMYAGHMNMAQQIKYDAARAAGDPATMSSIARAVNATTERIQALHATTMRDVIAWDALQAAQADPSDAASRVAAEYYHLATDPHRQPLPPYEGLLDGHSEWMQAHTAPAVLERGYVQPEPELMPVGAHPIPGIRDPQ